MEPSKRPLDFKRIRSIVTPRQALELTGWRIVTDRGKNCRGPCPFHGSKRRNSTSLSVCSSVVYCHVCQWKGDALAVWAHLRQLSTLDAAYDLCERLRIYPPYL